MILNQEPAPYEVEFWDTSDPDADPRVVRTLTAKTEEEARAIRDKHQPKYNDHIGIIQLLNIHLEELEPGVERWTHDDWQSLDD